MSLIQMQRHLNQLRHSQVGQQRQLTRLALNRILEAKQGRLDPAIAGSAYQVAISWKTSTRQALKIACRVGVLSQVLHPQQNLAQIQGLKAGYAKLCLVLESQYVIFWDSKHQAKKKNNFFKIFFEAFLKGGSLT